MDGGISACSVVSYIKKGLKKHHLQQCLSVDQDVTHTDGVPTYHHASNNDNADTELIGTWYMQVNRSAGGVHALGSLRLLESSWLAGGVHVLQCFWLVSIGARGVHGIVIPGAAFVCACARVGVSQ